MPGLRRRAAASDRSRCSSGAVLPSASLRRSGPAGDFPAFFVVDDNGSDFFAEATGDKSALPVVGNGGKGEKG